MPPHPTTLGLPYSDWHPGQWSVITRLASSDKPYTLLQAPTGSGKSAIVKALARLCDDRLLVCTGTKQLQDQYAQTLQFFDVRGRNNFPCLMVPSLTADAAPCTIGAHCDFKTITTHTYRPPFPHEGCEPCDHSRGDDDLCPYYDQRYKADSEPEIVLNYAYWLSMANYAASFRRRAITVFDEAHTLEDEVRRFATIRFSRRMVDYLGLDVQAMHEIPLDNIPAWQDWASEQRQTLAREHFQIEKNMAGPVLSADDERRRKAIQSFVRSADLFQAVKTEDGWVGERQDGGLVEFKPVWIGPLAQHYVYRHLGKRTIFMSGTILDPDLFATQLGLNPADCDFLDIPSTFPAARRPLIYDPLPRGNYRDPDYIKEVVSHIDDLIDLHPGEKGIIHTVSHKLANDIIRRSRHTRRMIGHETRDKASQLAYYRRSTEGIWVSPSSAMGVDLPYEECLWQIIAKIPFPNRGDKQIKQMMKEGPDGRPTPHAGKWYNWSALCSLMQAYGRGMRAPDDRCTTYLIDSNWRWFKPAVSPMLPVWFREAFKRAGPRAKTTSQADVVGDPDAFLASLGIGRK